MIFGRFAAALVGGAGGIRTPNPRHAKAVLSQLSYGPNLETDPEGDPDADPWWAMVESNHRPRSYQDRALTS